MKFEEWKRTISCFLRIIKIRSLEDKLSRLQLLERVLTDKKRIRSIEMMFQAMIKRKLVAEEELKQLENAPDKNIRVINANKKKVEEMDATIKTIQESLDLVNGYDDKRVESEWTFIFRNDFNTQRNRLSMLRNMKNQLRMEISYIKQPEDMFGQGSEQSDIFNSTNSQRDWLSRGFLKSESLRSLNSISDYSSISDFSDDFGRMSFTSYSK